MNLSGILEQTELKQARASNPKSSAFVSANAGSGKTYVLVKRILRLLIEGVDPSRILALTYTTTAAANMSIRVFRELSEWVGLEDEELKSRIFQLDKTEVTAIRIKQARQLFARAVETPGGLKIQTIHAFCERLLHLFPFEANVPANFEIIDDHNQSSLMAITRDRLLERLPLSIGDNFTTSILEIINLIGDREFESLLAITIKRTQDLRRTIKDSNLLKILCDKIKANLQLDSNETAENIWEKIYNHRLSDLECNEFGILLLKSTPNDQKIGSSIIESSKWNFGDEWKAFYLSAFFTTAMKPRSDRGFVTAKIRNSHPILFDRLLSERDRLSKLYDHIKAINIYTRTRALLAITGSFLNIYDAQKNSIGMLDFDDLILKTKELLSRSSSQWVLYKLDNGIEHILLDEAQDTSPNQWDILKLLTEEFYSGESNKRGIRTIFAVGDPKQSIYSFQGAEPNAFAINKSFFKYKFKPLSNRNEKEKRSFYDENLTVSFRSTPEILYAVDKVFSNPENYQGLNREPEATVHSSQRMNDMGLVEFWQPITEERAIPSDNWDAPLDAIDGGSAVVTLARNLALHVNGLISSDSNERIYENHIGQRRIHAGDILILVRKRGKLFESIIRALKEMGLPVAGADRLNLNDHIAIMDLVALGKAVITPDDDLTLATLLKSPLFDFSEDELLLLAAERRGSLVNALFNDTRSDRFKSAKLIFQNFRDASQKSAPFSFYSFVLGACGGRKSFRKRLGAEADDVIDEFLRLALEHEQKQAPSLLRFIDNFISTDFTVKRDMDSGRNQIRVMTVHGAKGLEAPIVYMPDTFGNAVDKQKIDPIFNISSDPNEYIPIWSPSQATDSKMISKLREDAYNKEAEEHRRLLYVAMTRARDRLYILGFNNKKSSPKDCWYSIIEAALSEEMVEVVDGSAPVGAKRLQLKPFPPLETIVEPERVEEKIVLPEWVNTNAPHEEHVLEPLRPSEALRFIPSSVTNAEPTPSPNARRRGVLVHKLLEYLPEIAEEQRPLAALTYLKTHAEDLSEGEHLDIRDNALNTLNLLDISPLFSKESRAEIDIAGELQREGKPPREVIGTIDRIAITEDTVFIGDFKTTASPPRSVDEVPEHTVAQIAIYGALVSEMFPDKKIRCFAIYTAGPEAIELPVEILNRALSIIE